MGMLNHGHLIQIIWIGISVIILLIFKPGVLGLIIFLVGSFIALIYSLHVNRKLDEEDLRKVNKNG